MNNSKDFQIIVGSVTLTHCTLWYHCSRHLSLPRSGITTKGVNSGGAHPQPSSEHAEKVADICISPKGPVGHCRLAWSPSPSLSAAHFPVIVSFTATWGPSDCHGVNHVEVPFPLGYPFGEPPVPPSFDHHWGTGHPGLVLAEAHCLGGLTWERLDIHFLPWTGAWVPEGWLLLVAMKFFTCVPVRGQIQSLMGSPCLQ